MSNVKNNKPKILAAIEHLDCAITLCLNAYYESSLLLAGMSDEIFDQYQKGYDTDTENFYNKLENELVKHVDLIINKERIKLRLIDTTHEEIESNLELLRTQLMKFTYRQVIESYHERKNNTGEENFDNLEYDGKSHSLIFITRAIASCTILNDSKEKFITNQEFMDMYNESYAGLSRNARRFSSAIKVKLPSFDRLRTPTNDTGSNKSTVLL